MRVGQRVWVGGVCVQGARVRRCGLSTPRPLCCRPLWSSGRSCLPARPLLLSGTAPCHPTHPCAPQPHPTPTCRSSLVSFSLLSSTRPSGGAAVAGAPGGATGCVGRRKGWSSSSCRGWLVCVCRGGGQDECVCVCGAALGAPTLPPGPAMAPKKTPALGLHRAPPSPDLPLGSQPRHTASPPPPHTHLHGDAGAGVAVQAAAQHVRQRGVLKGGEGDGVAGVNDGLHLLDEGQVAAPRGGGWGGR